MNSVIGYYSTKFGERWNESLTDLMDEAILGVLKNTSLDIKQIDAIFIGNMLGGIINDQVLLSGYVSQQHHIHIPVYRCEGACASGGMAFQMATEYLSAGKNRTALVLGVEKMTDSSTDTVTQGLATASSLGEQEAGLTFPGVYGLIAQRYLHDYRYSEEHLAYISVKNHDHACKNENAHFQRTFTVQQVLASMYVAKPLKVLDSSPISDGASAVIVSNQSHLYKQKPSAKICASQIGTDSIQLANRKNICSLQSTIVAQKKSFKLAGITQKDISVAELHDCFTIAEIIAMEDLGFWKTGEGGAMAKQMVTHLDSGEALTVNTSGGLKASGHPVGATGVKQIGELFLQLTNQATSRQVSGLRYGLAHNVGGSGAVAVVTILGVQQ